MSNCNSQPFLCKEGMRQWLRVKSRHVYGRVAEAMRFRIPKKLTLKDSFDFPRTLIAQCLSTSSSQSQDEVLTSTYRLDTRLIHVAAKARLLHLQELPTPSPMRIGPYAHCVGCGMRQMERISDFVRPSSFFEQGYLFVDLTLLPMLQPASAERESSSVQADWAAPSTVVSLHRHDPSHIRKRRAPHRRQ